MKSYQTVQLPTMNLMTKYYKWTPLHNTQNSNNETEVYNRFNNNNALEHQIQVANPPRRHVHTNTKINSHQDQVLNNSDVSKIPLCHFVQNNIMCSHTHHAALIGLIQLAKRNSNGILASIENTTDLATSDNNYAFSKKVVHLNPSGLLFLEYFSIISMMGSRLPDQLIILVIERTGGRGNIKKSQTGKEHSFIIWSSHQSPEV